MMGNVANVDDDMVPLYVSPVVDGEGACSRRGHSRELALTMTWKGEGEAVGSNVQDEMRGRRCSM
jgi:hypothetical protein